MPDDGVFRAILFVLVVSAVFGAAVMLTGEYVFHSRPVAHFGTGIALVCGALYFVFRWLGKREMRRRDAARTRVEPGRDQE